MSDRCVLVTGCAGEIGRQLVDGLLADGWNVCGLDRKAPAEVDRAGYTFRLCDLGNSAQTEESIQSFHERFGAFDAVINCAGVLASAPVVSFADGRLVHHDFELWDQVLASCLSSAFYVSACTIPKMVATRKKGVVINISSISSRGNPGQVAYSAAKAGLNGLTAALAKELGPLGIRVVALAPGYFDAASTRDNVPAAKLKEIERSVPLKRLGTLSELVDAVRFIIHNEYVNGTVIELDGGLVI